MTNATDERTGAGDYSATDFNHVESAVSTAEMGVRRLAEVAGLPLKGKSFGMS